MNTLKNFWLFCQKLLKIKNKMKNIILSTITGFGCGVVFAAFKLPVPAPPVFAGVAGIIGIWIGFTLLTRVTS